MRNPCQPRCTAAIRPVATTRTREAPAAQREFAFNDFAGTTCGILCCAHGDPRRLLA